MLACTFGLRHAFDADHIAAVDGTTRKLIADDVERRASGEPPGPRPLSVGFWFSLGHSTIVFALALLLSLGVKALLGPVQHDDSRLHTITGVVGPSVSGVFPWVLGVLNLLSLVGIAEVARALRGGQFDEEQLEQLLERRGFANRFLAGVTRSVRESWHVYPVGVLFGLGFDTATEVGLLVLAGGVAAFDLPFYAVLVLPVLVLPVLVLPVLPGLFAAGMCLMDTADGVFMNAAHGWAFARPARKVFYDLTVTTTSVVVALVIGTVELVGVLADRLRITTDPVAQVADVDLGHAGFVVVALFVLVWAVAVLVWRLGRVEQRWSPRVRPAGAGRADDDVRPESSTR